MKTCGMFDDDQPDKFFGLPSRVRADGGGVLLLPRPPTPRGGGGGGHNIFISRSL